MIMRNSVWQSDAAGGSEIEALQTDVMRFMAILGFCLMVIFALVQSIPTGPEDNRLRMETQEVLQAEITQLHGLADNLQLRVDALQEALAKAKQQLERSSVQERVLETLGQAIEDRRRALEKVEAEMNTGTQSLTEIRRAIEREKARFSRLKTKLDRQVPEKRTVVNETKPKKSVATPKKDMPPSPKGFSLGFASNEALLSLLQAGRVEFYARTKSGAWRLEVQGRVLDFKPTKVPARYYEMAPATVPKSLVDALRRKVTIYRSGDVVWGVVLPPDIVKAINKAMQGRPGGELVIQRNGSVVIE